MLATFYAKSEVLGNIEGSFNVHLAAENANMDIESDEFHSLSRSVTGEEHIDDMNHIQKLKMVARINALKKAGVMTGKDIKNLVLNLLKNVNKETRGEIIYDAEILSGMEMGQLIQIAGEKEVPNVDRFVDDATSLPNLELKNDIVEAILETQDKLYLQMGIGMFPMFKKSTKNRIFRWFSQAWRQSQDRYSLEDREFVWWSRKVLDNLPMNLQNYWVEWSENVPKVTSVDKIKMFVGDGISGKTQDEANIDRAVDFGSEYVNENIKGSEAEEINLSKGKLSGNSGDTSFREGFNRVNATAFNPLGIYIDSEEAQIATVLVLSLIHI